MKVVFISLSQNGPELVSSCRIPLRQGLYEHGQRLLLYEGTVYVIKVVTSLSCVQYL